MASDSVASDSVASDSVAGAEVGGGTVTTEPVSLTVGGPSPDPSTRRRIGVWVLAVLTAVAVLAAAVIGIFGAAALPWDTAAESRVSDFSAAESGAKAGVLAFLDVDYHDMDARIAKVKKLSTGTFKEQYAATATDLKAAAEQAKAVSSGSISHVGINRLTDDSAILLVTASNVVSNVDTTGEKASDACPHDGARCDQYRFIVTVTKVGSDWLLSDLAGAS